MADEKMNLRENLEFGEQLPTQETQVEAKVEYQGPVEVPNFGQPSKLEQEGVVEQVEALPIAAESTVDYNSQDTTPAIESAQKDHEEEILLKMINHEIPLDDARKDLEEIYDLGDPPILK